MLDIAIGHKPGGDNCCNGNKVLDTIQRVLEYGGHKGDNHNHGTRSNVHILFLGKKNLMQKSFEF